jgi:hypothetical protein
LAWLHPAGGAGRCCGFRRAAAQRPRCMPRARNRETPVAIGAASDDLAGSATVVPAPAATCSAGGAARLAGRPNAVQAASGTGTIAISRQPAMSPHVATTVPDSQNVLLVHARRRRRPPEHDVRGCRCTACLGTSWGW